MAAAGIACREDVEKEMRKNCISSQPKTQLTSTHPASAETAVKPSLKGPLSPHSIYIYAFLGRHKPARTLLGDNRFTAKSPQSIACIPRCRLGCRSLTACKQHRPRECGSGLGQAAGKTQGRGLKVRGKPQGGGSRSAQPRRGAAGTCDTNLPDAPGARPGCRRVEAISV